MEKSKILNLGGVKVEFLFITEYRCSPDFSFRIEDNEGGILISGYYTDHDFGFDRVDKSVSLFKESLLSQIRKQLKQHAKSKNVKIKL